MQIMSPYGKDALSELQTIYGLSGPEAAANFVTEHVREHYALHDVSVETLHVAFGLTAKIRTHGTFGQCFYLKFASRHMHHSPEQLFPWLEHARRQGIPVPEVIRTVNNSWFLSPLEKSAYDVVYLMREVHGTPLREARAPQLEQYAEAMAKFHRIGMSYPHSVAGSTATWNNKFRKRLALWNEAESSEFISSSLLKQARQVVEETGELSLSSTIIHGDFRFCHVFFQKGKLTGLVDIDLSTQGERWLDFCGGLLSGNSPESGNFLTFDELRQTLAYYDKFLPLEPQDRTALKATFAFKGVEDLLDLSHSTAAGTTPKQDMDSFHELLRNILESSELLT